MLRCIWLVMVVTLTGRTVLVTAPAPNAALESVVHSSGFGSSRNLPVHTCCPFSIECLLCASISRKLTDRTEKACGVGGISGVFPQCDYIGCYRDHPYPDTPPFL
ncbi:hypothetical protein P389DRAFT_22818 [Cystobasidium minutum MCA 4210]|uniref:uncharacterized protein n=1 Tax=Cystobasidium minutum MCA 4210 TaxID=1397322 RepID=UPI0034CE8E29|eukprot:jgi/Rhomi1/22818/CE22817_42